jgi:hypothetical protein
MGSAAILPVEEDDGNGGGWLVGEPRETPFFLAGDYFDTRLAVSMQ